MADLEPLIRLRKHTVEEKQKILSALYREAETLEAKKQKLIEQMNREREIAENEGSPETLSYYGRYAENVRKKIEMINETIKKMELRIAAAQEEMRVAFAEMKKVEIVHRRRKEEERSEIDKKESAELDEIAIDGFRRQEETE